MKNSRAFTLIELLVVVLIIGILAAVAVPQYQVAVAKSRATQLWIRIDALNKAAQIYHLSYGEWPTDVRELDIDITHGEVTYGPIGDPVTTTTEHTGAIYENGDRCAVYVNEEKLVVACFNKDIAWMVIGGSKRCIARNNIGEKVCAQYSLD